MGAVATIAAAMASTSTRLGLWFIRRSPCCCFRHSSLHVRCRRIAPHRIHECKPQPGADPRSTIKPPMAPPSDQSHSTITSKLIVVPGKRACNHPDVQVATSHPKDDAISFSKHVLLDSEMRHDLAADFLDRGMRGVQRGNVFVAEDAVGDRKLVGAAIELRI